MSPHTALRVALTHGTAALVVRRPGGRVHLWQPDGRPVLLRSRHVLPRGSRPVCGQRGKRYRLVSHVDVDAPMCGRCAAWAYARLPADLTVPDVELPALVRGAVAAVPARRRGRPPVPWALERALAHVITPWRGQQITTGLDGKPVAMQGLVRQVREHAQDAPKRREQAELYRLQAIAEGEPA